MLRLKVGISTRARSVAEEVQSGSHHNDHDYARTGRVGENGDPPVSSRDFNLKNANFETVLWHYISYRRTFPLALGARISRKQVSTTVPAR